MPQTLEISPSSVFLASGGARGITAQCVIRLAQEYGGKWILLGRSEISRDEPEWAADCVDEAELKKRILQHLLEQCLKPTPKDIQKAFKQISTRREVLETLKAIENAGGQAEYLSADITDLDSLQPLLAEAVDRLGEITGILHGAGNLADKLIEKKTEQDFETVYAAKVQGLENLLRCVPAEQLAYLVLFSSVAGFYGNAGQADYAIANEILNKSAHWLRQQFPSCHTVAINWGPWESGMVTPELKKIYAQHGVDVIPVLAGTQLLAEELRHRHDTQVVIGNPLPSPNRMLLDSELRTHCIRRHLVLADNPFLNDHKIAGYPVLPATCAIGWMINACEQIYPGYYFFSCENFKVFKGIIFDEQLSGEYSLELKEVIKHSEKKIEIEAKIWSKSKTEKIQYHYTSQLQFLQKTPEMPVYRSLDLVPDQAIKTPIESFYQTGNLALFHGASFQGITHIINVSLEKITAQALWPKISDSQQGQFQIQTVNPFVTDLCMHPIWIWTQHFHDQVCLPAEVQRFEQFLPVPSNKAFYISTEIKSKMPMSVTANFIAHDDKGLIYFRMMDAKATLLNSNMLKQK
jgi:NAD(P)-dependent dehydrogenase (short-subunit alcohol dehydrogenase family)